MDFYEPIMITPRNARTSGRTAGHGDFAHGRRWTHVAGPRAVDGGYAAEVSNHATRAPA
jgi:hypothetical protein